MRCAVVLALEDPRSSGAGTWIDAVAWLRQELTELGYRVAVIDGEDVEGDLVRALHGVTSGDEVFLHVSGRLVDRGVVCTAGGRWVRLRTLGEALAKHAGANVSVFAEVVHEDGFHDTQAAAEYAASIVDHIGARSRQYAMIASVRASSDSVEGLALTRLFVEVARAMRPNGLLVSSAVYERIAGSPAALARAQHFTFVPGFAEAPLPSFASEPLPSFETEPHPSAPSLPLPSFESEPPASFGSPASSLEALPDPPADPSFYASAFAAHQREGRSDAAFLAALALEELGAADAHQQVVVDQLRSIAPIRARGMLDPSAWQLLCVPGSTGGLAALFAAVARPAVASRLEQIVAHHRLFALDPDKLLDENSTASVVRSFHWAARVLGVTCPALYVVDDVPGEIAAVRAQRPSTALGPSVLRGRSAKELAFLAGRHLTYYRPEHQVLVYFPTSEDLHALLTATIELADSGASPWAGDATAEELRGRLERHTTTEEREAIAAAGRNLRGDVDLSAWARGVELSAGRAGLLLCGDLATASAVVRTESRAIAGLTPADRRNDLLAFVASPEHTELRERYVGLAQPPTPTPTLWRDPTHTSSGLRSD